MRSQEEWDRTCDEPLELGLLEECKTELRKSNEKIIKNGGLSVETVGHRTPKSDMLVLRLVVDLISSGAPLRCIEDDTNGLPSQLQWAFFALLDREFKVLSQSDRRPFFSIWRLRECGRRFMVLGQGSRNGRLAFTDEGMGWILAVETCQHLHRNMAKRCGALPARIEIRGGRAISVAAARKSLGPWKVYIDDFKEAEIFELEETKLLGTNVPTKLALATTTRPGLMKKADEVYEKTGARSNSKKKEVKRLRAGISTLLHKND